MQFSNSFEKLIPKINDKNFASCAMDLFQYQAQNNLLYSQYLKNLGVKPNEVKTMDRIPFLPIEFFKTSDIKTGYWEEQKEFLSSGTTGAERSSHLVRDISFYEQLSVRGFEHFYGELKDFVVLALLPSYQAQKNSSLIAMVNHFISLTKSSTSGYVTAGNIKENLKKACSEEKRILIIGASYALLDVSNLDFNCDQLMVMETGGMKGRRKELTRDELHFILRNKFKVDTIHSEYGMTELLSQAYAKSNGEFSCPPWMSVFIRDLNDPFEWVKPGNTGGLNLIDLANIHTCAFIETKDIGQLKNDRCFKVLGRFDNSDLRGCNLLMA